MTQKSPLNRYLYPYAQGVKLDIRKKGITVYRKYPARLHGSLSAAYEEARKDRDAILGSHGIENTSNSARHVDKREGAPNTYQDLPLPPGLSVQYVRGKPMYFVVRDPLTGTKTRFAFNQVDVNQAHALAMECLKTLRPHK